MSRTLDTGSVSSHFYGSQRDLTIKYGNRKHVHYSDESFSVVEPHSCTCRTASPPHTRARVGVSLAIHPSSSVANGPTDSVTAAAAAAVFSFDYPPVFAALQVSLMLLLPALRVAATRHAPTSLISAARPLHLRLCPAAASTHRLSASSSSLGSRAMSSSSSSSSSSVRRLQGWDHSVCAVLGGQWGDEGKGKLVDILARDYDVIARFNGGSNAGHTLVVDGQKFAFHLLPCGLLYPDKVNVIGNGVVLHVPTMLQELDRLQEGGKFDQRAEQAKHSQRLLISDRAHLLFDFHQSVDGQQEKRLKDDNIGTTKKGIGPAYASKATRNGIRVGELLDFDHFTRRLQQVTHSTARPALQPRQHRARD